MALTLQKTTSINIGVIVNNAITGVKTVRAQDQAKKESAFQEAVANGLDYEGQVAFRQKQLDEEEASGFVDEAYRNKLKESLASTKRLKRFYDYRQKHQEALGELNAGHTNAVEYANTLRKLFDSTDDPDLQAEIQTNLTQAETKVTEYKNTVLSNQVKLAENDGSEKEINKVLKKVKQARSFASINGNDDEVAAYDLTIASLNSQKVQNKAEDIVNDVAVKGMLGTNNSTSKLKTLNLQVAEADTDTPVTINGKRFDSEQQYWEITRNAYLSGAGSGVFADYFSDLETQYKQKIDGETARFGFVQPSTIQKINTELNTLRAQPEMAAYVDRIDSFRAIAVADAVSTIAKTAIDRASFTGDYLKADDTLKNLGVTYGVDTTGYQLQLGTRLNQDINASIAAGEGVSAEYLNAFPNEDFATPSSTTDITPPAPTPVAPGTPAGAPATPPASTMKADYDVKAGDTLGAVAARNNMSLTQLLDLNPEYKANPNAVQIGAKLKLAMPVPVTPAPVVTPVASPVSPTPQPKAQPIENSPVTKNKTTQVDPAQEKQLRDIQRKINKLKPQVEEFVRRNQGTQSGTITK